MNEITISTTRKCKRTKQILVLNNIRMEPKNSFQHQILHIKKGNFIENKNNHFTENRKKIKEY